MNNKSPTIQAKIAQIQQQLARPISEFQTGGFRPSGERTESWIGRVFLCKADEACPISDMNGNPLYPLAQFYLPSLPFVPEQLKHITWLTVFMGSQFPQIKGQYGIAKVDKNGETHWQMHTELGKNGDGWLIREYTANDTLVEYEFAQQGFPKPFPLKPIFKARDFPLWDGGGVPSDLEDEICKLENGDKDDCDTLDYYTDIVGDEHSYAHKFGGYPSFCQSGVAFDNGCQFMFQISSDDKACFNVVDSGSLMFARNQQGDWVLYYDFY